MKSDQLRLMARGLAEMVKKMPKLDWTQRESVRADLRRKVRRLLAMYGYPPDLSEDATQLVLKQAELSTSMPSDAGTDASSEAERKHAGDGGPRWLCRGPDGANPIGSTSPEITSCDARHVNTPSRPEAGRLSPTR